MNLRPRLLALCAWSLSSAAAALAQQPPAAATASPAPVDPAVQALLDTKPATPADLYEVVRLMLSLEAPEPARPLVAKLLEIPAEDPKLVELGRKLGRGEVASFGETPTLQPEAKQFADRLAAAVRASDRDPQRIAQLIARLQDPAFDVKSATINLLRAGGDATIAALLDVLADPSRAVEHSAVRTALAGMGEPAVGPLRAMIASGEPAVAAAAVRALALIEEDVVTNDLLAAAYLPSSTAEVREAARTAVAQRLRPLPEPIAAAAKLYLAAERLYKKSTDDPTTTTLVWTWDAAAKKPVAAEVPLRADELRRATRLADDAATISGGDAAARRLAAAAALEAILTAAADPATIPPAVAAWQTERNLARTDLEKLYDQALSLDRRQTAVALVWRLAASGTADELLIGRGGKPSTLVRAATDADPHLRFTAVGAIFGLNPTGPFAGSSGVIDSMAWFATAEGVDRVVVVDRKLSRARDTAAMLADTLRVDAFDDVAEAARIAATQADVRLVLLDRSLIEPDRGGLLARLRSDFRSARLPVGIVCEPDDVARIRSRYYDDPFTFALYRPTSAEHLQRQFALTPLPGAAAAATGPQRIERANSALAAMRQIAGAKTSPFNLRSYEDSLLRAAASPVLAKPAFGVLANFGSAAAQRTLADAASLTARPLDVRQAAASAFCDNVARFGTLLTTSEISRQYARYNAAESLDAPTQELLGAILDAVEARAGKISVAGSNDKPSSAPATP